MSTRELFDLEGGGRKAKKNGALDGRMVGPLSWLWSRQHEANKWDSPSRERQVSQGPVTLAVKHCRNAVGILGTSNWRCQCFTLGTSRQLSQCYRASAR